jgi:hypothetical protein
MNTEKEHFLRGEFLTLSINGALGRSYTYSKSASDKDKANFRTDLRRELEKIAAKYTTTVLEQTHVSNTQNLADGLTSKYRGFLVGGRFRIGIAQKALNLYLKYLWCLGLIPLPPHCPFDNRIIHQLPECADLKWTLIDTIADYMRLVEAATERAAPKSLSEWELRSWNG